MQWYAHSGHDKLKSDWQLLPDHLISVATLAAEFARPLKLEKLAFLAGLFHDLGKYTENFQRRLEGHDIAVDHSTAGAKVLKSLTTGIDQSIAEIINYCILGHHAGLPDRMGETTASFNQRMEKQVSINPEWKNDLSNYIHDHNFKDLVPDYVNNFSKLPLECAFSFSVMGRMIFSCLVDADFKDTEAFYAALNNCSVDRDWPKLHDLLPELIARFNAHMAGFSGRSGELNSLRRQILSHIRNKAVEKPGLFTLTVPTGGGKTLASLGFALDHAQQYGHQRIIYAIPFTSIIDQTATIFRQVLGSDYILEHHSSIENNNPDLIAFQQKEKLKLAMEDWAAPIVVTTNVQLFESLFSAKTSRNRKLHNIANSIIILDEAQTLPRHLLLPTIRMLRELAQHYGCTIVLCTATQPALGTRKEFPNGLPLEGRELAPDPVALTEKLARTQIHHIGEMNNAALIDALAGNEQALVIVNSRRHALDLYKEAKTAGLNGLVHLTTRQYSAHRQHILTDIRDRLKSGAPCRLIATSLIEAGVDIDFPVGWRAEAGLEQIIQAAGRVNREGKRPQNESFLHIFSTADYPPPAEIKTLINAMQRIFQTHENNLASLQAIEDYFSEVYWQLDTHLDAKNILSRFTLSHMGSNFAYRSVGQDYRMIESGLVPVIIKNDQTATDLVHQLSIETISSAKLARQLQPYMVQIPSKARDLLCKNGHVTFVAPQLRADQFAVLETASLYQSDVGLLWEDADYLGVENMIV